MRLAAELGERAMIDLVDRGIVGEQKRAAGGEAIPLDPPRGKTLAICRSAGIGADGGKHVEKRRVALPVLLGQIADGGR